MLRIGPDEKKALNEAVAQARAKPLPIDVVMRGVQTIDQSTNVVTLAERKMAARPPTPALQQVELPFGYRVAISYEEQPAGMCLHLSMSGSTPGKVPHPEAVSMVLEAIGIGIKPDSFAGRTWIRTWIEEFEIDGKSGGLAVNVVVLMTPAGAPLALS